MRSEAGGEQRQGRRQAPGGEDEVHVWQDLTEQQASAGEGQIAGSHLQSQSGWRGFAQRCRGSARSRRKLGGVWQQSLRGEEACRSTRGGGGLQAFEVPSHTPVRVEFNYV